MTPPTDRLHLARYDVVGADLDMTLLDTRRATAHALRAVNVRCGEAVDVDAFVSRLGPPIREELRRWIAEDRLDQAVHVFRSVFLDEGVDKLVPMPGASDLCRVVHRRGGRLVVITSRILPIAEACLEASGLEVHRIIGGRTGRGKAPAMIEHAVQLYIGDHVLDMEGATAAGIPAVGVTTGSHDAAALRAAGATFTVASLDELRD